MDFVKGRRDEEIFAISAFFVATAVVVAVVAVVTNGKNRRPSSSTPPPPPSPMILSVEPALVISSPKKYRLDAGTEGFYGDFDCGEPVVEGNDGVSVFVARRRSDDSPFAVKCYPPRREDYGRREIENLERLRGCSGIIEFVRSYDEDFGIFVVMKYYEGGDLFRRVEEGPRLSDVDAARLTRTLVETLVCLHEHYRMIHRDVKLENVLLGPDGEPKLCDFEYAFDFEKRGNRGPRTMCGTLSYVAPEILSDETYDEKVDVWSLGVLAFMVLLEYAPFDRSRDDDTKRAVRFGIYDDSSEYLSDGAREFLSKTLVVAPKKRFSARECLSLPWFS